MRELMVSYRVHRLEGPTRKVVLPELPEEQGFRKNIEEQMMAAQSL